MIAISLSEVAGGKRCLARGRSAGLRLELRLLLVDDAEERLRRLYPRLLRLRSEEVGDLEYSLPLRAPQPALLLSFGERLRALSVLPSRRCRFGEVERDRDLPRDDRREWYESAGERERDRDLDHRWRRFRGVALFDGDSLIFLRDQLK